MFIIFQYCGVFINEDDLITLTLSLPANIRIVQTGFPATNALAYFGLPQ